MASQVSREQPDIHNKRKEDNSFAQDEAAKRAKSNNASSHPIVPIIAVPNNVIPADGSAFVVHLANTKVESPHTKEGKIFFGLKDDSISSVYRGLITHNCSSCPVLQKTKHRWCGFLDIANIVKFIVEHFGESVVSAENANIMQLLDEKENFKGLQVLDIMKNAMGILSPYHPIYEGYSLLAAYEVMARSNLHHLAVIDSERRLVSVVTQSQMVEETFKNIELLGAKRSKLVNSMSYNMHEVYHVSPKDLAIAAFTLMSEKKVSGIAVIGDDGMLVDQISMRDLKAMGPDAKTFWRLFKPVSEYIENVKKSHTDVHAKERPSKVVTVTPNDTIETVLGLLVKYKIHRVYIVEDANKPKPIGLITLRDIMLEAIPGGHW